MRLSGFLAGRWFPLIDLEAEELVSDEESDIYHFLDKGIDAFSELGEVRCTNRFLQIQRIRL